MNNGDDLLLLDVAQRFSVFFPEHARSVQESLSSGQELNALTREDKCIQTLKLYMKSPPAARVVNVGVKASPDPGRDWLMLKSFARGYGGYQLLRSGTDDNPYAKILELTQDFLVTECLKEEYEEFKLHCSQVQPAKGGAAAGSEQVISTWLQKPGKGSSVATAFLIGALSLLEAAGGAAICAGKPRAACAAPVSSYQARTGSLALPCRALCFHGATLSLPRFRILEFNQLMAKKLSFRKTSLDLGGENLLKLNDCSALEEFVFKQSTARSGTVTAPAKFKIEFQDCHVLRRISTASHKNTNIEVTLVNSGQLGTKLEICAKGNLKLLFDSNSALNANISLQKEMGKTLELQYLNSDNLRTLSLSSLARGLDRLVLCVQNCEKFADIKLSPRPGSSLANQFELEINSCNRLQTFTLPDALPRGASVTFTSCPALTEIVLPAGLKAQQVSIETIDCPSFLGLH